MSNKKIFRAAALARLSSPEQLDTLLTVTTPKGWLALIGLGALILVAVVWAFLGSIATKAMGTGVVIRTGGVFNVRTTSAGQILQLDVDVGDTVTIGQIVARVAQPEILERISLAEARLNDARTERDRAARVRDAAIQLQLETLDRREETLEQQVRDLQEQARLVREQIPVEEQLLERGLITRQQLVLTQQRVVSIESNISSVRTQVTQIQAERYSTRNAGLEPSLAAEARIAEFGRQLDALQFELESATRVTSPYAGQVLELKVFTGNLVGAGTPVLSLQSGDLAVEGVFFISAAKAKSVQPGMAVEVSPTSVRREEFGFMHGEVVRVSDFPATQEALMRLFENAVLVQSLTGSGPVHQLSVRLLRDPENPERFLWSSSKAADISITAGTLYSGQVVTRRQRPISEAFSAPQALATSEHSSCAQSRPAPPRYPHPRQHPRRQPRPVAAHVPRSRRRQHQRTW